MQCKQPPQYSLAYFNKNKNLNETDISLFCLNEVDLDIRRHFELIYSPGRFPGEVTQLPDLCLRLKAVHLALKTNQSLLKMPPLCRSSARKGGGGQCQNSSGATDHTARSCHMKRGGSRTNRGCFWSPVEEDVQLESAEPRNIFDWCSAFMRATDQRLKVSLKGRGTFTALWLHNTHTHTHTNTHTHLETHSPG